MGHSKPVRWPDYDGPWEFRTIWEEIDGRNEPVGFTLEPVAGSVPMILNAALVKSLPFRRLVELTRSVPLEPEASSKSTPSVKGVRKRDRFHFEKVAWVYANSWRNFDRAPTRAVAEHFNVKPRTAAEWVRRARIMGLLDETTPGKAGAVGIAGTSPASKEPSKGRKKR